MTLTCPKVGEVYLLRYIVNIARDNTDHNVLHLFSNDVPGPISEAVVRGSFTEPAGGTGYAAATLVGGGWTITQNGDVTTAVYSQMTFTFTTGVNAYGYFVTDTSNNLLWAERFDGAPFQLPASGGTIAVTPKLTLE